jgi:hypothetical protein
LRRICKISVDGVGATGAVVYNDVTETSGEWQEMMDPSTDHSRGGEGNRDEKEKGKEGGED